MNEKEICELMDKIPTFEGSKSIYNSSFGFRL